MNCESVKYPAKTYQVLQLRNNDNMTRRGSLMFLATDVHNTHSIPRFISCDGIYSMNK